MHPGLQIPLADFHPIRNLGPLDDGEILQFQVIDKNGDPASFAGCFCDGKLRQQKDCPCDSKLATDDDDDDVEPIFLDFDGIPVPVSGCVCNGKVCPCGEKLLGKAGQLAAASSGLIDFRIPRKGGDDDDDGGLAFISGCFCDGRLRARENCPCSKKVQDEDREGEGDETQFLFIGPNKEPWLFRGCMCNGVLKPWSQCPCRS